MPEAALLRLRVTHRSWANNSAVDTEEAMAYSVLTGDEEPVALTETGPGWRGYMAPIWPREAVRLIL